MTGTLHLREEIRVPEPRNQQLAIIRIGKTSHSVPPIPLRESKPALYRKFPRTVRKDKFLDLELW